MSFTKASNTLLSKLDAVYHSAIRFVTKAPYTTPHCDLYALVGWPSLHIRRQTHWLQVIYKSFLGKAPPYLCSLVTITTLTRSTCSSRYISLVIPKANTSFGRLSFQFSAANDWNDMQNLFLLFCTLVFLLAHHQLHIYHSSVNLLNCNYFTTMAYLLPYLLTPFAHIVY